MGSAADYIGAFHDDLENVQDKYDVGLVSPYTRSFIVAKKNFEAVLKGQADKNKALLSFALGALSLVGGSALTFVFGKATLKAAAAEVALDSICRNNLQKAFELYNYVAGSETASFIVGELWDQGQGALSKTLKDKLEANETAFPSLKKFKEDPVTIQTHLSDFVKKAKTRAHDAAAEIRDNEQIPDSAKIGLVGKIRASEFCKPIKPGVELPPVDEKKLADEIELSWWMMHVLELDYVLTTRTYGTPPMHGHVERSRKRIKAMPSSGEYPKYKMRGPDPARMDTMTPAGGPRPVPRRVTTKSGRTWVETNEVRYDQVGGGDFRDRIEELYKKRTGKGFFEGPISKAEMRKAEAMLRKIGGESINKLANEARKAK